MASARVHFITPNFSISFVKPFDILCDTAIGKQPSERKVILQEKLLAEKFSAVCTLYKQ